MRRQQRSPELDTQKMKHSPDRVKTQCSGKVSYQQWGQAVQLSALCKAGSPLSYMEQSGRHPVETLAHSSLYSDIPVRRGSFNVVLHHSLDPLIIFQEKKAK